MSPIRREVTSARCQGRHALACQSSGHQGRHRQICRPPWHREHRLRPRRGATQAGL